MGFCTSINLGLILIFALSIRAQMENDLLEFISVSGANTEENVYLTDNNPEVLIDAMSKTTRSVYILGSSKLVTHIVRFSCEVGRRATPLTDIKFCCGVPDQKLGCHQLSSKPKVGQVSCNGIAFDYVFNTHTGANFTLSFNPITNHTFAYNRQIYCEVKDSEATIQSNVIDLRDAIYYAIQLGVASGNNVERLEPAVISPQDFPLKFSCGDFAEKIQSWPSWMAAVWQRYLSPFEWAFCQIKEPLTPFGCAKDRMPISVGESVTTMDGTLFLISDKLLINYPNSAFVCIKRGTTEPITVYASDVMLQATPRITRGFVVDSEAEPTLQNSFEALSPTSLNYQFVDGTVLSDFNLLTFYRVPRDAENVKFAWYRDGKKLSDRESDRYSFRLPDRVERSFSGTYEFRVEQNSQVKLKFTYVITVVGPPKFRDVDCVEDLFYALEGSDRRFLCLLSSPDESATFKVGINGFEAQTTEQLKNILASTLQLQSQPISQLDINFWRVDAKGTNGVVVDVKNLQVDQNFRLSIKAINAYGQSQVAGTLRVVPKPALVIAPSRASCSIDCNDEPFEVQCVPTTAVTRQWTYLNITSLQGWVVGRTFTIQEVMAEPALAKYFAYDSNNTSVLRVSPYTPFSELVKTTDLPRSTTTWVPSSQSSTLAPRETLQDALNARLPRPSTTLQIECRFQLFVDNPRAKFDVHTITGDEEAGATTARQRRRRQVMDEQRKIYDSYNEPNKDLHDTLMATRTFSEMVKPLATSFAWVAAVVIAVVFIVIVVIVGVWLCTRNRGETYKLSKKEYKLGNDPLRELKEKETFQAYERPEEPPSLASAIDEPDLEVSSDDDGELEAYKIDPARSKLLASPRTFNEDASFIGQYNTPSRAAVNGISTYRDHHTAV